MVDVIEGVIIVLPMCLGLLLSFFKTHRFWIEMFSSRLRIRRKSDKEYMEIGEKLMLAEKPSLQNNLSNGYFNITQSLVLSADQATTEVLSIDDDIEYSRADTISTINDRDVHLQIGFNDPFNELRSASISVMDFKSDSNAFPEKPTAPSKK